MKKVKKRTTATLLLAALLVMGLVVYIVRYCINGEAWASAQFNDTVYNEGVLAVGRVVDRNGIVLADITDGERTYADDWTIRVSSLHAVGDTTGNIGTGALSAFASKLMGYNIVTGAYSINGKGNTVKLSIDANLNAVAYEALAGRKGVVAVCNYETGEVICMVSGPSYDPLDPPDLSEDDSGYEGVYINRFLSSSFTPGSIYKLVTLAAAIENIDDLYDRTFYCDGTLDIDGDTITCTGTHGEMTIEEALAVSCNCVFAELSLELGAEKIEQYAAQFGLLESYEISGIETAAGNFDRAESGTANLAWSGIGQYNDTVNPCAVLRLMSAIANDGKARDLTLLKGKTHSSDQLMDASTAEALALMMNYNVSYTYGTENYPGLSLYAKSGTAEVADNDPHAWFVGFIDNVDAPLAFVVMVENGGWGSAVAGSVANTVLQAAVSAD